MPTLDLKFSAAEVAAILADHVERTRRGTSVKPGDIRFDIEPACSSPDPREYRAAATLRCAVVPATEQ